MRGEVQLRGGARERRRFLPVRRRRISGRASKTSSRCSRSPRRCRAKGTEGRGLDAELSELANTSDPK